MQEYHQNLSEVVLSRHRKSNPLSPLDANERKQLRAVLGSLQWLVAQLRFDMAYGVSTFQSNHSYYPQSELSGARIQEATWS